MSPPLRGAGGTAHRLAARYTFTTSSTPVLIHTPFTSRGIASFVSQNRSSIPAQRPRNLQPSLARPVHTSPRRLSTPKFTYGIAASFTAKGKRYNPSTHVFNFNPYNQILARRKAERVRPASGQDAFFVSRISETQDIALGIADGVGGWVDSGVDPADFSHGFCNYMSQTAHTHKPGEWNPPIGARGLMQKGYEAICGDESVPAGGSTACVAIAKGNGNLEVANLGDSGFVQLRLNAIHEYSEPQTHAFNTPYQLSVVPEKVAVQAAVFGGEQVRDFPQDAHVSQHQLRHGDVIVFASDGVWDNLSSQEVLKIVSRLMIGARAWEHTDDGVAVGRGLANFIASDDGKSGAVEIPSLQSFLAVGITSEAKAASVNTKVDGPFAREVQKYFPGEHWRGGKVDDICVVVAIACEEGK